MSGEVAWVNRIRQNQLSAKNDRRNLPAASIANCERRSRNTGLRLTDLPLPLSKKEKNCMIDPEPWLAKALEGLKAVFGDRLLYLGLQGSYRRGEATEASDIDLVAILDSLAIEELDAYRSVVHSLPEGEKACGFISGREELLHWPRHELFPFRMDTRDCHGRLDPLPPPIERPDIEENARIGASALYHLLTHSYLYASEEDKPGILAAAYKSVFFVMLVVHYLATGT